MSTERSRRYFVKAGMITAGSLLAPSVLAVAADARATVAFVKHY